jgi:Nif-specific regulatory protein
MSAAPLPASDRFDPVVPALPALEGIVAILTENRALPEALELVFDRLAQLGLVRATVAMIEAGGNLTTLAGHPMRRVLYGQTAALLARSSAGVIRAGRSPLLGAAISANGETLGLLTARGEHGPMDNNIRLLGLVANLIAPPLALTRYAPRSAQISIQAPTPHTIVGSSLRLRAALEQARRIAPNNLTVLLRGESGSGKELFARFIHKHSCRANRPFVTVNCPALAETALESELFGHERGAFTGGWEQRKGLFELADGGTLLLDEIGDLPASFQAMLLRVLQEGEFERIGGTETLKVDVRIVATTHRNLEEAVKRATFRADLYYRIAVAPIHLPALRERRDDIPALAEHILRRFNAQNCRALTLEAPTIAMLCKCGFAGNVRELENCIHAAAVLARGSEIVKRDFACRRRSCFSSRLRSAQARVARGRAVAI